MESSQGEERRKEHRGSSRGGNTALSMEWSPMDSIAMHLTKAHRKLAEHEESFICK